MGKTSKSAPAAPSPYQQAMGAIVDLLQEAWQLIDDASGVGVSGDSGWRILSVAEVRTHQVLSRMKTAKPAALFSILDALYNADALVEGALALHPSDARGRILQRAHELLDQASTALDELDSRLQRGGAPATASQPIEPQVAA